ncbi:N-acetyltransferase [Kineosporia sp. NBRC 101731]|nr:N-acetyltransferase [Kineosporia sp. NBRC 101731]
MHIRPAIPADLDALLAFPLDRAVGTIGPRRLQEELAAGRLRWPWTWLVLDQDGTLLGRALWWGRSDSTAPLALDCLHLLERVPDRAQVAADLLISAHRALIGSARPPAYQLALPTHWRDDPAARDAVGWRLRAAAAAALTEQVERLRYAWEPRAGQPPATGRLRMRPGTEREFLDLFERAAVGTLDLNTRRSLAVMTPAAQARDDYDFYLDCPGERDWWRMATTATGEPVGFIVPSATPYHRNVGYLGVLPAHRGRGIVDDLLAEIIRFHAGQGSEYITATTDLANIPMARALGRAGFRVTENRLLLEAPVGSA